MANWERLLDRWEEAGVVDAPSAERIRAFEAGAGAPVSGMRWPVIVAIAFGAVMVGSGVLLLVAARWDHWSPAVRLGAVLLMVAFFHLAGAAAAAGARQRLLSAALHGVGTAALGAGIFLGAQVFNLQEHWPGALLLWSIGAAAGWWLLGDWIQASFAAILIPWWIAGEWQVRIVDVHHRGLTIETAFLLMVALTYIGAIRRGAPSDVRRVLSTIGRLALLPVCIYLILIGMQEARFIWQRQPVAPLSPGLGALGWTLAILLPLSLAWWLRRRAAAAIVVGAIWVGGLSWIALRGQPNDNPVFYVWCLAGAIGMVWWGVRESGKDRINLGMAALALVVLSFYFSGVFDQLGRSVALIGIGLLFLTAGWFLERMRRRLIARIDGSIT